jgi:exopolysaccharide production protein ExoZ
MLSPLSPTPLGSLASIQVLRAVAALCIVVHHGLYELDQLAARAGSATRWQSVLPLEAGVDLFFVISGFVMVYASRDMFGSTGAIIPFLRRRLARIIPIYWVVTALYLVLSFGGLAPLNRVAPSIAEIATSLFFIPFERPDGFVQPVYSLGWTLNYEVMFYCLFALALPLKRAVAVPVVVGILMAMVMIGHLIPSSTTMLHFWTRSIIVEFGLGMIIGHMMLSGTRPDRKTGLLLIVSGVLLLIVGKTFPAFLPDRMLQFGLPAAMFVMAALAFDAPPENNPIIRPLTSLGDASYAIYLLHPFVLRGLGVISNKFLMTLHPLIFMITGITLTCILAMIIWHWFERPLTRALQGPKQRPKSG